MRKYIFAVGLMSAVIILSFGLESAYAAETDPAKTEISIEQSAILNQQLEAMKATLMELQAQNAAKSNVEPIAAPVAPSAQTSLDSATLDALRASLASLTKALGDLTLILQSKDVTPAIKAAAISILDGVKLSLVSMNSVLLQNTSVSSEVASRVSSPAPTTPVITETPSNEVTVSSNESSLNPDTENTAAASAETALSGNNSIYSSIGIILVLIAAGIVFWRLMVSDDKEKKPIVQESENS